MPEKNHSHLILHNFDREHKNRLAQYPEGFIPKRQDAYNTHINIDEIGGPLMNSLIGELPDDFFIADPDGEGDRRQESLVRVIERIGSHGLLLTTLDIYNARVLTTGKKLGARLELSAFLFFPQKVILPEQAELLSSYQAKFRFQVPTTGKADGELKGMPMEMVLPRNTPIDPSELFEAYKGYVPLIEAFSGEQIPDPDKYARRETGRELKAPGTYRILLPTANLATKHDAFLHAVRYGRDLLPALVQAARALGREICLQNTLDVKVTDSIIVSGLLPIPQGIYSDQNIASYFDRSH